MDRYLYAKGVSQEIPSLQHTETASNSQQKARGWRILNPEKANAGPEERAVRVPTGTCGGAAQQFQRAVTNAEGANSTSTNASRGSP